MTLAALDIKAQPNAGLRGFLESRLFSRVCPVDENAVARRVFSEYGALFAASDSVEIPSKCIFADEADVQRYQGTLKEKMSVIAGVNITLQSDAMEALIKAHIEAAAINLKITPLDGSIAGKRSFADTVRLWNSRFLPALDHWIRKGRISAAEASAARNLAILEQVKKVIEWESRGLFFSTNFKTSIFSSVAPPGTSQHLSMLAFDVVEYRRREVREILNRHGWYQTIANDPPHFTFLGVPEGELPRRGLRAFRSGGFTFWIPNILPPIGNP